LRDIHVTGTSFNGRCTVFPAGFFGCQLPVLRQHIHRNKSTSLEPYLQIVSENHWHGVDKLSALVQHQQHRKKRRYFLI
jgi:hypothetical protein